MKTTNPERFVMLQINDGGLAGVTKLIHQRDLQLRDSSLLLALMSHTDTVTGRIKVMSQVLADDLGVQDADIRAGISRLKKNHLLRLVRNRYTGERYYLLNPWVVRSGKDQAVGLAMREFQEA